MTDDVVTSIREKSGYRSIQILRAVAAMLVALMHLIFFYCDSIQYIGGAQPHMATLFDFKGFGGSGMQIFFVISGFIMAYLYDIGETKSFSDFVVRRLTRIVPLYWIATILWAYVLNVPGSFPLSRVLQSLFFIPRPDNTAVLGPGWSLNFEMFFYMLFGLSALVFRVSFLWVAVVFLVFNALAELTGFYVFRLYSDPIVWNFIAGIAIFHIHRLPWVRREAPAILWTGVAVLVSSIFWHVPDSSYGIRQFLPWGVPSMLIVLGAVGLEADGRGARLFGSRVLLELGNASYSLYLVHTMCFIGVSNLLLYKMNVQKYIGPDGAIILYLAVCCGIAVIVHRLIEKPATRITRRLVAFGSWMFARHAENTAA